MATLRVYLDTRRAKSSGEYPVKIVVNHRKDIMISTGISAFKSQFKDGRLIPSAKNSASKNAILTRSVDKIEKALFDLEREDRLNSLSDTQLKNILTKREDVNLFFETFERVIKTRRAPKTAEIYQYTLDVVREYDDRVNFRSINREWLDEFVKHLSQRMSVNSISIHLRNIRAVFNLALDDGITTSYPFRKYQIKSERTAHRNLELDEMKKIIAYNGKYGVFRDFFLLSFYLIGMNMKDLLYLEKTALHKDRISYNRSKTGSFLGIKVEPEAMKLIEKYKGEDEYLLNFIHLYKDYDGFKRGINYSLKKLSDDQGVINSKLSTYYARHSWASIASSIDIPNDTISAALGHSHGSRVTSLYINFDRRKIDEANRMVIDEVAGR
ncbi:Integrase [Proteiniphilum saccharofermentans]|uniref:Integrase n=1 Tax=Proteiniphilum saccharofermentans TaxID=1642647 RepID=A0A1R3T6L4_9BACT|nr:site-specific integrase [Proteiniphilum saccharofermentans]SCD19595.1 Integrase [Proteiniphilum saccharofermentans]